MKPVDLLPVEFRSGNDIPVERATIKRERMIEIITEAIDLWNSRDGQTSVTTDGAGYTTGPVSDGGLDPRNEPGISDRQERVEPIAWVKPDIVENQFINMRPRRVWWECNEGIGMAIYTSPQPQKQVMPTRSDLDLATEIWAAAQLAPGEGIEDGENRIAAILAESMKCNHEMVCSTKPVEKPYPIKLYAWGGVARYHDYEMSDGSIQTLKDTEAKELGWGRKPAEPVYTPSTSTDLGDPVETAIKRFELLAANRNHGAVDPLVGAMELRAYKDSLALQPADPECSHRIFDMRNANIKSGFMCADCGQLFAAAEPVSQHPDDPASEVKP